jgi:hypothetical protein
MRFLRELKRSTIIPLAALGLGAFYLFVLVPLSRRANHLDTPLNEAWHKLAVSLEQTNATAIDFLRITNQLYETRQALKQLDAAKKQAVARLELGATVRARMQSPFQLFEYEEERSSRADALRKLAKQQAVTIEPAVFAGFPEHTADVRQPTLLWPALSMIEGLLGAAIRSKVATVHTLEAPLKLTQPPPGYGGSRLAEVPLQLEVTGPVSSVARFILSLTLRADETRAAGLSETPADKPPLFIDRLVIKKQSAEKLDEVRVWVRAVGFVWIE